MKRKRKMKRKLNIATLLIVLTLAFAQSGCGNAEGISVETEHYDYSEQVYESEEIEEPEQNEEQADGERFKNGRFYYTGEEFGEILSTHIEEIDDRFSLQMRLSNEENYFGNLYMDGRYIGSTNGGFSLILLNPDAEKESFESIWVSGDILSDTIDIEAIIIQIIMMSNTSLSFEEAQNITANMVSADTLVFEERQIVDGIVYSSQYMSWNQRLELKIYADGDVLPTQENNTSPTNVAYDYATRIKISDLNLRDGRYSIRTSILGDIEILSSDVEAILNVSFADLEHLEDDAIYNSYAKAIEGFYVLGEAMYGNWRNGRATEILGFDPPDSWEEMRPYVDELSQFITNSENTAQAILRRFEVSEYIIGDIDIENISFDITITDTSELARELMVTEYMIGFILAALSPYGAEVTFDGNICYVISWQNR